MGAYVEQLECLNCSQSRGFILHGDREQRLLGQTEAARQVRRSVLTCARCGSGNLIRGWTDALPYATEPMPRRQRRKSASAAMKRDG